MTTKKQANHPRRTEARKVFPLFKCLTECHMFLLVGAWACLYFVYFSSERTRNVWSGLLKMQLVHSSCPSVYSLFKKVKFSFLFLSSSKQLEINQLEKVDKQIHLRATKATRIIGAKILKI